MEGKLPGGRPGGSVWHDVPGSTKHRCPLQTHDLVGRPQIPQDPQWPYQRGREAWGHFMPSAFGFPTEASSAEGLGCGEMPVLRGDSFPSEHQLYQALKSPWLNVRASLPIPPTEGENTRRPQFWGKMCNF